MPITIDAIDSIPIGCGFSDSKIMPARNRSISQTGGLWKTLTLKLESEIILTTNIDITDRLINEQIRVVKYFKLLAGKVDIIYIKFDEINADKKMIQTDNLSRHNSWVPIKRTGTHITSGNSYISTLIQRTQFPLTLVWACTIHKVQGLSLPLVKISH